MEEIWNIFLRFLVERESSSSNSTISSSGSKSSNAVDVAEVAV